MPAAAPVPGPGEPTLEQMREATAKYRDVNVALAEGYVRDPFDLCDTAPMMGQPAELGAMGIHYVRMDLLGITAPPSFHGVPFDHMRDDPSTEVDEAHKFEPHFDRHVWLYRDNPRGVFASFNPNVSCANHTGASGH